MTGEFAMTTSGLLESAEVYGGADGEELVKSEHQQPAVIADAEASAVMRPPGAVCTAPVERFTTVLPAARKRPSRLT